jgi:hypothetical protein
MFEIRYQTRVAYDAEDPAPSYVASLLNSPEVETRSAMTLARIEIRFSKSRRIFPGMLYHAESAGVYKMPRQWRRV